MPYHNAKPKMSYEDFSPPRHSCCYCQRLIIEPSALSTETSPWPFKSFVNSFDFNFGEVIQASKSHCAFFQWFVRDMSDTFFPDADANIQPHIDNNSDRRILIHFQVEPATFDVSDIEPSSPSYTCSVSWIWEWADESKERPFWHGSDMAERHSYELCREHGMDQRQFTKSSISLEAFQLNDSK